MKHGKTGGFTLIEVMLAVCLFGIIAAAALLPLVFTVESMEYTQKQWGQKNKTRTAFESIFTDVRSSIENPAFLSLRTVQNDGISIKNNGSLMVWTSSPIRERQPAGLVIYKVINDTAADGGKKGLYRWYLAGGKNGGTPSDLNNPAEMSPMSISPSALKSTDGKLILEGVDGISFWVWSGKKWVEEYEGNMPEALKIEISLNGKKYVRGKIFPAVGQ